MIKVNSKNQIHKELKEHSPSAVHKAKKLFAFKYPKFFFLVLSILLAYYVFSRPEISALLSGLDKGSYLGIFIAGIFFAFGFSAPFATGFLIVAQPENLFFAAILGGFGALVSDMFIFKSIKFSFMDEFGKIKKTKLANKIREIAFKKKHILIKHYFLYVLAGILIATPLPDEFGVSMLAGLTTINEKKLAIISFLLNSLGIFLILYFSASNNF